MKLIRHKLGSIYICPSIGSSALFRRKESQDLVMEDTKMFPLMTIHFLISIFNLGLMIESHMREKKVKFDTNVLHLGGCKDLVCNILDQKNFIDSIQNGNKLKEIHLFPEALHEPLHDYEAEEFFDKWGDFMKQSLRGYKKPDTPIEWEKCRIGLKILHNKHKIIKRTLITILVISFLLYLFRKRLRKQAFKLFIKFMQWYHS